MEINLEVVHSIIKLQLKNHENTLSTSGVLLILLKIALRKISKSPLTFNLKTQQTKSVFTYSLANCYKCVQQCVFVALHS